MLYFFDFTDNGRTRADRVGTDFETREAAQTAARQTLACIAAESGEGTVQGDYSVSVRTISGEVFSASARLQTVIAQN